MSGCGRQFCGCGQELIHRDHRHGYESSSALGQIVSREGPLKLSAADIDLVTLKGLRDGRRLIRVLEQKQPTHGFKPGQQEILQILDGALTHCKTCPTADLLKLDARSGVFIIHGNIAAADSPRKETVLHGEQTIRQLSTGAEWVASSHEDLFRFLDPEDPSRRGRR